MKKIIDEAREAEEETYSEDVPKKRKAVIPGEVIVSGKTSPDAKLTINNQEVIVSQNGEFLQRKRNRMAGI